MPDRARLRELFDTKCVCTDEAELEICPRCLGLMSVVEQLPALLDALDEAEKERDAAQTAHGELFGTFAETEARLDEAERLIARADRFLRNGSGYREEIASWLAAAREALARIGAGE